VSEAPFLFLDARALAALRRKARTPMGRKLLRRIEATAAAWLKRPPMAPPPFPSTQADRRPAELLRCRTAQNCLIHTAFMYRLSGEQRWLDRCWRELECWTLRWKSWCDPFHGGPEFFDLMTGELGFSLALAYDWCKSGLSPGQRALLSSQIRSRVLDCYRRNILDLPKGRQAAWWRHSAHNWNPVCHGGALVAALALRDEYPAWRRVVAEAKHSMEPYFSRMAAAQASDEGTGYWQYGMRYGLFALEALRCAGLPAGPWMRSRGIEKAAHSPRDFSPGLRPVSWGDAASLVRSSLMYLLAARFGSPSLLEYADSACALYKRRPPTQEGIEDWDDLPLGLIWRPEGAPRAGAKQRAEAPEARHYPRIGWSCHFDSWRAPKLVAGFKCGDLGANHSQLDNNSFQIRVRGDELAEDLGGGVYNAAYFSEARWAMYPVSTAGHNSLLINGKGQLPHTLGRLSGSIGDASACYGKGVLRAKRHFLVVDSRWILVLDDVLLSKPGSVEWRCHSFAAAKATPRGALLRGSKGALALYPLGGSLKLREQNVLLPLPGAAGVTQKPALRRERLLTLRQAGQRRFLLPVLMHAGPASSQPPRLLSHAIQAGPGRYSLEADFGAQGKLSFSWKDGPKGLTKLNYLISK
jgi:hypothetical protein